MLPLLFLADAGVRVSKERKELDDLAVIIKECDGAKSVDLPKQGLKRVA